MNLQRLYRDCTGYAKELLPEILERHGVHDKHLLLNFDVALWLKGYVAGANLCSAFLDTAIETN